jgi:hypothetical protein
MSKQVINVGAAANDGTGDTLRVSQQKANDNFTELYNEIGKYLKYRALLSKVGTANPTVDYIFENTIGNIVWTSSGSTSESQGSLSGAFTVDRTIVKLPNQISGSSLNVSFFAPNVSDVDTIVFQTFDFGGSGTGYSKQYIEILVKI